MPQRLAGNSAMGILREHALALQEGGVPGDEELTGLGGKRLMLAVKRKGGGSDHPTCYGRGAGLVKGEDGERSVVSTSFAPGDNR